ncbi:TSUP family transporter [Thalassotalea ponticola]|uniref:TSUP family transporter n=1 Tax=Thalassotalea ponticola TaxID=1523392 RepID=UPI0025B3289B|nr:TSUP family transporter [Thalassotalea ponticola]MDN3653184.1 TSUP family transporter [Thalassotalea ponticola]
MLEIFEQPSLLFLLSLVGLLAGFIDAIAGGGGLLTVPALLTTGLPPHLTLGTNKLAACFGSFTSSLTFYRKKLFDPIFWLSSAIATAIGAFIGTIAVNLMSSEALNKVLPIIILLCAVYALLAKTALVETTTLPLKTARLKLQQRLQGVVLGFYDGVAGPGTGTFWVVSNLALYKMNILLSSALAKSMNFISNFVSLVVFLYLDQVNIVYGLAMGVFMVLGSWLGAHSAIRYGSKFIRPVFISVVVIMALRLAYEAWVI